MASRYKAKANSHMKNSTQPGNANGVRQRHNLGAPQVKKAKHNPGSHNPGY